MTESTVVPEDILERICAENLAVYRESPARLQEDVSQESQVAHDYRGRLIYESLQNADDALVAVATTDDRVVFRLTDHELWVANTGRPFTEADVRGLCGLGASSKAQSDGPKRASIGHKGLGFKSVLEITHAPEAYSETVSFRLGRVEARSQVEALWEHRGRGAVRDVPAMRFPSHIAEPHPYWTELKERGFHSAFRFPFHNNVTLAQETALARQLLELPMTSVLFLKHLEEVRIEVDTAATDSNRDWLLERHQVTDAGLERCSGLTESGVYRVDLVDHDGGSDRYWVAHNSAVPIGNHRDGLTGPAWEGVDVSEVSVAVRDEANPTIPVHDRRFHVFLPTQEPAGCSMLVNGAFTTDLSRQHVRVTDDAQDYNAYLVRQAAATFADTLVPHLLKTGGPAYVLRVLAQTDDSSGKASTLLTIALTDVLSGRPLLPAGAATLSLSEAVLPTPLLGARGHEFAELMTTGATIEGRRFPDPAYCEGDLAAVCGTYGATALSPVDTLRALARNVEPTKSKLYAEPRGRFQIDPLLDLCTTLWENADADDRQELQSAAPKEPIFPTGTAHDGTVKRIVLGDETAFYPPRASAEDMALGRIKFIAHAVCWGSLLSSEQSALLEEPMKAWSSLFDIKAFRFEEVMRAAVLPGLARTGTVDTELAEANRSIEALATICRLAGKTTKPDQPLPLGRLGSDRAFFNLARLEVPCRTEQGSEATWAEAHQVYFGRDWVGEDSVEEITDAMAAAGVPTDVRFIAPPEEFAAYATTIGVHTESDDAAPLGTTNQNAEAEADEVGLDDDTEEALETNAIDRWRNFFAWLGVSRGLRLIHFNDVNDTRSSWTSTKGLTLPSESRAFHGIDEGTWRGFRDHVEEQLSSDPRWESCHPYLYQVHNLDLLNEIGGVAKLRDNDVAETLLNHLVRNWPTYARHTEAQVALVGKDRYPAQRTNPPRAGTEELASAGLDLWVLRLRRHTICPTSQGPRRPEQTWRRSDELVRRLGGRRRNAEDFVPVLKQPDNVPSSQLRACLDELGVRGELTPAVFTVDDARDLCKQISTLYPGEITEQHLREEIRPVYRQLFELIVGSASVLERPLADAPLAARTSDGLAFLQAKDVVYASVSGSRERSGVQSKLPLFVLEAEPGAQAPLRNLFGTPFLEDALEWAPEPGEPSLEAENLEAFRTGLRELMPFLLARLSADRADRSSRDRLILREYASKIEPVDALTLRCTFRGEDLGEIPQRPYFVSRNTDTGFQGFVVWGNQAWPPLPEDRQTLAMAFAEALEVNTVETFLSFINATDGERRQLLRLAGAGDKLEEVTEELDAPEADATVTDTSHTATEMTDGESTEVGAPSQPRMPVSPPPATPRVPLRKFEDLLMDGDVIHVEGIAYSDDSIDGPGHNRGSRGSTPAPGTDTAPRAAAGTDLSELDRLGMRITFGFERRRLAGLTVSVLPGEDAGADADALVIDVSSPAQIMAASEQSAVVKGAFERLAEKGISPVHPGFDVLTIKFGDIDRLIELKSSGVDAQVQAMSWNEWTTANGPLRDKFYLYLVGNLRADLPNARPYLRAVHDPVGTLSSTSNEESVLKRTIQLRVREFPAADELKLSVRNDDSPSPRE